MDLGRSDGLPWSSQHRSTVWFGFPQWEQTDRFKPPPLPLWVVWLVKDQWPLAKRAEASMLWWMGLFIASCLASSLSRTGRTLSLLLKFSFARIWILISSYSGFSPAKRCQVCQLHSNFIHQSPEPLHLTAAFQALPLWCSNFNEILMAGDFNAVVDPSEKLGSHVDYSGEVC